MIKFFHRLLHPHCPDCMRDREEAHVCQSCETLKEQLNISNFEKKQMLNTILSFTKPIAEEVAPEREIEPIRPKTVPWNIRRNMLEDEDRKKAALLKQAAETDRLAKEEAVARVDEKTEELERELNISGSTPVKIEHRNIP